jgi:uncharacterized Rossmann fold enzyme
MASMRESAIRNYLSNIDFNKDWSYEIIEQEIQTIVGERPSMDVKYRKDVMLLEGSNRSKEITKLEEVSIVYTDLDNKIKILID